MAMSLLGMSSASVMWLPQMSFEATPATPGTVPIRWPGESSIPRQAGIATLLVFAHPRCPCTRATLHELVAALDQADLPVAIQVLFGRPSALSGQPWQETDCWRQAGEIAGATVNWDDDGREAERFGARVSGHVMLFDRTGNLCFDGGITAHRGQEGINGFRTALVDMLRGRVGRRSSTPVFGCSLVLPE